MKIDFKNQTLKSAPATSCYGCDASRELCEILYAISDVCFWMLLKTAPKVVCLTYENTTS